MSTSNVSPQGDGPAESETLTNSSNTPPIAHAGPDLTAQQGTTLNLDGSASSDANGDPLTYTWSQTSGPVVTLKDAQTQSPSFYAAIAGVYTFQLTLSDGKDIDTDSVTITVQAHSAPNLLSNGDFSNGFSQWTARSYSTALTHFDASTGEAQIEIVEGGDQNWHIQLFQTHDLVQGQTYTLSFDVKGSASSQSMNVLAQEVGNDWSIFANLPITLQQSHSYTRQSITWTQSEAAQGAKLVFAMGNQGAHTWSIDNVSLTQSTGSMAETRTLIIGSDEPGGITTSTGISDSGHRTGGWLPGRYLSWNTPVNFGNSGYLEAKIDVSWKDSTGLALTFTQQGWSSSSPVDSSFKGEHTLYLVCEDKPASTWFAIENLELINP